MSDANDDFFAKAGSQVPSRGRGNGISVDESVEEETGEVQASRWGVMNDNYYGVATSSETIAPGVYSCHVSNNLGPYLSKQPNDIDDLLMFPDNPSTEVLEEIRHFATLHEKFAERGYVFKRGILLWGPPGSGKTSTIQLLIKQVIEEMDGIAVHVQDPRVAVPCLKLVRQIEPDRQIIVLMEDLDALVQQNGEAGYLSMLDGEDQISNVIYVATTNYPEYLDKRFVDRPSRFDTIKFIDFPEAPAREAYFKFKEPGLTDQELAEYVAESNGFSVAHMKELIIATKCFEKPFDETIKRLKKHVAPKSTDGKKKIGMID